MHHFLHHHVITHIVIPLLVSTAVAVTIASTSNTRGSHPAQEVGKLPSRNLLVIKDGGK